MLIFNDKTYTTLFFSVCLVAGLTSCGGGGGGSSSVPPAPTVTYTLTVVNDLNGSVTILNQSDSSTETCSEGATCSFDYNENTALSLSTQPQSTYQLASWGDACSGTGNCALTVTTDLNVTTDFEYLSASARACIEASPAPTIPDISWQTLASGLTDPVAIASADDFSGRLYIGQQNGIIRSYLTGGLEANNFLDISDRVLSMGSNLNDLSGLMSMAFHPDFATNGLFYVYYISERTTLPNLTNGQCSSSDVCVIISEFDTSDLTLGIPSAERILLDIPMATINTLGGHLSFGPETIPNLYISIGDSGSYQAAYSNALTGKLIRIDVNNQDTGLEYSIPSSNPSQLAATDYRNIFINNTGRSEIWASGFHNPWQFSFDILNGSIYLADDGEYFEEINLVNPGYNYGYSICEGPGPYSISGSIQCGIFDGSGTPDSIADFLQIEPIEWWSSSSGSIIGGTVYRGSDYASLCGAYIYADNNGNIKSLRVINGGITERKDLTSLTGIIAFGVDQDLEIYAVSRSAGTLSKLTVP